MIPAEAIKEMCIQKVKSEEWKSQLKESEKVTIIAITNEKMK
jgi:hypothetical protein